MCRKFVIPFWSSYYYYYYLEFSLFLLLVLKIFFVSSLLFWLKMLKQTNKSNSHFQFLSNNNMPCFTLTVFCHCLPSIKNSLCSRFPSQKCYKSVHSMNQKFGKTSVGCTDCSIVAENFTWEY